MNPMRAVPQCAGWEVGSMFPWKLHWHINTDLNRFCFMTLLWKKGLINNFTFRPGLSIFKLRLQQFVLPQKDRPMSHKSRDEEPLATLKPLSVLDTLTKPSCFEMTQHILLFNFPLLTCMLPFKLFSSEVCMLKCQCFCYQHFSRLCSCDMTTFYGAYHLKLRWRE